MLSRPTFYAVLAVLALIAIFFITSRGNQKTFPVTADSQSSVSKILGLMKYVPGEEAVGSAVERVIQSGAKSAKDVAGQTVNEAKDTIVENVKKEVSRMTEAQVKQLTTQLCKEWGIPASSSAATTSAN